MKEIVELLKEKNKTISTMESCTGGFIASSITDIEGSSEILKFSAVTYSNEYKIKMGVKKETIDEYSVYSIEVAKEMSKQISDFAGSNYGIGITGKLNRQDESNTRGKTNEVHVCIYDKDNAVYNTYSLEVVDQTRHENKELILNMIIVYLKEILNN
ncbi:MAG: nicotinamide-nucleotide amidohydrolase family protein [Bacilli bacterium]|nr:nicotinamide-nucleotide amidohydrolase family protein [Bacilli bacterium]